MKIEIDIDESILSEAASRSFCAQFAPQRFGHAFGVEQIEKQVQAYVRQIDFTPYIQAAAKAKLDDVVGQVVEQALREAAKKKAKQMHVDGSLFT